MSGRSLALCYHAVSPDWPASLAIEPERLRAQVEQFLGRGYEPVTFHDLVSTHSDRKRLAVTFDDAYLSVYELAYPVLKDIGVPATVFVPTAHVGGGEEMTWPGIDHWLKTEWRSELRGATWDQLRELRQAGWEIGSHTRTHPRLTELGAAELMAELEGSRLDCEREIGQPCRTIAYPYGDFDDRVADATRAAGYQSAAALAARAPVKAAQGDPLRYPRAGVYRGDSDGRIRLKGELISGFPRAWNLLLALAGR